MTEPDSWLRFGLNHDCQILVIEPLFEEANRCRRLIAEFMRALDALGIGGRLANLPGTGESLIDIADVRLADWHNTIQRYTPRIIASFRGGALLDSGATHCIWRFAPETGARIVRDLRRAALASGNATLFAGHALSSALLADLESAVPAQVAPLRTVRLETDPDAADLKIAAPPLWRRAEPGEDLALSTALATDLSQWISQCAAS